MKAAAPSRSGRPKVQLASASLFLFPLRPAARIVLLLLLLPVAAGLTALLPAAIPLAAALVLLALATAHAALLTAALRIVAVLTAADAALLSLVVVSHLPSSLFR